MTAEIYDIERDELAKRARRPKGSCKNCVFWEVSEKERAEVALGDAEGAVFSDVDGECHQQAPRPVLALNRKIGNLIGDVAWAAQILANVEHHECKWHYDVDGERANAASWPRTNADDWCGAWMGS